METLVNGFARSLLIYLGAPMVAAGLWNVGNIETKEKSILKESMLVPQNMSPDVIANTMRNTRAAAEVVRKLTSKVLL